MTVSTKTVAQSIAIGEKVSRRHYVIRFRCPHCQKPYAKRTAFVTHIRACRPAGSLR